MSKDQLTSKGCFSMDKVYKFFMTYVWVNKNVIWKKNSHMVCVFCIFFFICIHHIFTKFFIFLQWFSVNRKKKTPALSTHFIILYSIKKKKTSKHKPQSTDKCTYPCLLLLHISQTPICKSSRIIQVTTNHHRLAESQI